MRCFADQRQPFRDVTLGQHQAERIGPARPDRLDRAEEIAEAGGDLGGEGGVRERHQTRRQLGPFGPHDRGAVAGHRQDRKRSGRRKMLDGDAAMRALVPHGRHDPGLAIAPLDGADAGGAPQPRPLSVGRCDQTSRYRPHRRRALRRPQGTTSRRASTSSGARSERLSRDRMRSSRMRRSTRFSTM